MKFVSYAQNFEDVMLWRALGSINNGFYVDVGAWYADVDSVTKAFYDHGWSGINIEPNPEIFTDLQEKRERDINKNCALSDKVGTETFYTIINSGLSTLELKYANTNPEINGVIKSSIVNVDTLNNLFEKYVKNKTIHFMKIDVEGYETRVIQGNNWEIYRPWILVVEATEPGKPIPSFSEWENILLNANYLFAYDDGLNRFYIAGEKAELRDAFRVPPNVFDDFVKRSDVELSELRTLYQQTQIQLEQTQIQLEQTQIQLEETSTDLKETSDELTEIKRSKSWRLTSTFRCLRHKLKK